MRLDLLPFNPAAPSLTHCHFPSFLPLPFCQCFSSAHISFLLLSSFLFRQIFPILLPDIFIFCSWFFYHSDWIPFNKSSRWLLLFLFPKLSFSPPYLIQSSQGNRLIPTLFLRFFLLCSPVPPFLSIFLLQCTLEQALCCLKTWIGSDCWEEIEL